MTLGVSMATAFKPLVNFQGGLNMEPLFPRKDKVVFVVGPTGTGKSRLAIDLATRYPAEVVNCDKMQVYKGLDVVTNKVTPEECRGVKHHLLGIVEPNTDFTSDDFKHRASVVVESIAKRDRLPIIAGGSNSYIEALVNDAEDREFRRRCEFCFLWVDVYLPVLHSFVSERVNRMIDKGLVEEVRNMFVPDETDYSRGIRRAIGVPELDQYLRYELGGYTNARTRAKLLDSAISKIKENTCILACRQLQKIHRLHGQWKWNMHRIDATEVFLRSGEEADETWDKLVLRPSVMILDQFLSHEGHVPTINTPTATVPISLTAAAAAAMATATR
ncbi:hypothetical protein K2173_022322 [Erythroxylum novogranatense]|uniref:adenylate dimethylallyltransferase (ADP/ATP-dependent) n=1 Tax=Erythroxylum novogranatense TaxID=1862640 RepID=A0AAV8TJZ1_9ROSI|nr:hypothetical protein K2173_022322 [Erythroxylum novogranatense]